uniref:HintC domain-containing protein n=1 Tax=Rhabditophanes sp. KR3021 TaxID=114890 RepID=A0AC35TYS5_9BILA
MPWHFQLRTLVSFLFLAATIQLAAPIAYRCENDQVLIVQSFGNDTIRMHCQKLQLCGYSNLKCNYEKEQPACGGKTNFVAHVKQMTPIGDVAHTCCDMTVKEDENKQIMEHDGNDCFVYELPDGTTDPSLATANNQAVIKNLQNLADGYTVLKNASSLPEEFGDYTGYRLRLFMLRNKSPPLLIVKAIERTTGGYRVTICRPRCGKFNREGSITHQESIHTIETDISAPKDSTHRPQTNVGHEVSSGKIHVGDKTSSGGDDKVVSGDSAGKKDAGKTSGSGSGKLKNGEWTAATWTSWTSNTWTSWSSTTWSSWNAAHQKALEEAKKRSRNLTRGDRGSGEATITQKESTSHKSAVDVSDKKGATHITDNRNAVFINNNHTEYNNIVNNSHNSHSSSSHIGGDSSSGNVNNKHSFEKNEGHFTSGKENNNQSKTRSDNSQQESHSTKANGKDQGEGKSSGENSEEISRRPGKKGTKNGSERLRNGEDDVDSKGKKNGRGDTDRNGDNSSEGIEPVKVVPDESEENGLVRKRVNESDSNEIDQGKRPSNGKGSGKKNGKGKDDDDSDLNTTPDQSENTNSGKGNGKKPKKGGKNHKHTNDSDNENVPDDNDRGNVGTPKDDNRPTLKINMKTPDTSGTEESDSKEKSGHEDGDSKSNGKDLGDGNGKGGHGSGKNSGKGNPKKHPKDGDVNSRTDSGELNGDSDNKNKGGEHESDGKKALVNGHGKATDKDGNEPEGGDGSDSNGKKTPKDNGKKGANGNGKKKPKNNGEDGGNESGKGDGKEGGENGELNPKNEKEENGSSGGEDNGEDQNAGKGHGKDGDKDGGNGKKDDGKKKNGKNDNGKKENGKNDNGKKENGKNDSGKEDSGKDDSDKDDSKKDSGTKNDSSENNGQPKTPNQIRGDNGVPEENTGTEGNEKVVIKIDREGTTESEEKTPESTGKKPKKTKNKTPKNKNPETENGGSEVNPDSNNGESDKNPDSNKGETDNKSENKAETDKNPDGNKAEIDKNPDDLDETDNNSKNTGKHSSSGNIKPKNIPATKHPKKPKSDQFKTEAKQGKEGSEEKVDTNSSEKTAETTTVASAKPKAKDNEETKTENGSGEETGESKTSDKSTGKGKVAGPSGTPGDNTETDGNGGPDDGAAKNGGTEDDGTEDGGDSNNGPKAPAKGTKTVKAAPEAEDDETEDVAAAEPDDAAAQNASEKDEDPPAGFKTLMKRNCFAADSTVMTPIGEKRMDELQIGDLVMVPSSNGVYRYEKVEMFYHRKPDYVQQFLTIETQSGNKLSLTDLHLLPFGDCKNALAAIQTEESLHNWMLTSRYAYKAQKGQCVISHDENNNLIVDKIIKIGRKYSKGIYSPITVEGSIVTDRILTSCFSQIESHSIQKLAYDAIMMFYRAFGYFSGNLYQYNYLFTFVFSENTDLIIQEIPTSLDMLHQLSWYIVPFAKY